MTSQPTPDPAAEHEPAADPTLEHEPENTAAAQAPAPAQPTAAQPSSGQPASAQPTAARPAAEQPAAPARPGAETTAVYVRRRRAPTLALWVTLAIVIGLLAGAITALVTHVGDLGGVLYFAVTGAVFVGLPLALIASIVDAVTHRGERRDRP